jgi:hypothetical protein
MFEIIEHKNRYLVLLFILVISNVFFAWSFFSISNEFKAREYTGTKSEINTKVLNFTSLFIKEVLKAEKEVDFETRLSLENSVRDLKDEEIIKYWQNFVGSKTEIDAQQSVKNLLEVLVNKIQQ